MSEPKTCGSCKHWGDDKDAAETFRRCLAIVHDEKRLVERWRDEDLAETTDDPDDLEDARQIIAMKARRAVVQDGSGYFAALRCRQDFGCVLHEPR